MVLTLDPSPADFDSASREEDAPVCAVFIACAACCKLGIALIVLRLRTYFVSVPSYALPLHPHPQACFHPGQTRIVIVSLIMLLEAVTAETFIP